MILDDIAKARIKELEAENSQLHEVIADQEFEIAELKELVANQRVELERVVHDREYVPDCA